MRNEAAYEDCSKTRHYRAVTIIVTTCRCINKAKLPRNSAREAKGSQRKPKEARAPDASCWNETERGGKWVVDESDIKLRKSRRMQDEPIAKEFGEEKGNIVDEKMRCG